MNELVSALRGLGYDIEAEPAEPRERGGSLVARRDLGDRVILVTVDASGRFRVELTWLVGEWPSRQEIAGVPLRIVDGVTRTVSAVGNVERPERLAGLLASLDAIAPWATPVEEPRIGPPPRV